MTWAKKKGNDCVVLRTNRCTAPCSRCKQPIDGSVHTVGSPPARLRLLCAACCLVHAAQLPMAQEG